MITIKKRIKSFKMTMKINNTKNIFYPFPMFYNPNMKMQNENKQPSIYYMMVPYMMYDPNSLDLKDKNSNSNYPIYSQYFPNPNFPNLNEQSNQDYSFNQIPYFPMIYPMNNMLMMDKNMK